MKLWLASGTVFFFLFLVFFSRKLPQQNWFFAIWLSTGVAMQMYFAMAVAVGWNLPRFEWTFGIIGWIEIAAAMIAAHRAQSAANDIIFSGLGALVILQIIAIAATRANPAPNVVVILASNLAGILPAGWMLARFVWTWSEPLALLAGIRSSEFGIRVGEALGYARAMLG